MSTARPQYTMVLPHGWSRIPVGRGARAAIKGSLDKAVARSDDRRAIGVRRHLQELLTEQVNAAEAQSGVELCLPTDQVHGVTVPASVLISMPAGPTEGDPMDVLLAVAAKRPGAEVVDIAGKPAVRTEKRTENVDAGGTFDGVQARTRQIVYFLADPEDRRRYAVVSAQVLEATMDGGAAVADAVTELIDAMLSTFRWAKEN